MKNHSNLKTESVLIPHFLKKENPMLAEVLGLINDELRENPGMKLAEFAEKIDEVMIGAASKRLHKVVEKQLAEGSYE
jgi:hypothetical protein